MKTWILKLGATVSSVAIMLWFLWMEREIFFARGAWKKASQKKKQKPQIRTELHGATVFLATGPFSPLSIVQSISHVDVLEIEDEMMNPDMERETRLLSRTRSRATAIIELILKVNPPPALSSKEEQDRQLQNLTDLVSFYLEESWEHGWNEALTLGSEKCKNESLIWRQVGVRDKADACESLSYTLSRLKKKSDISH